MKIITKTVDQLCFKSNHIFLLLLTWSLCLLPALSFAAGPAINSLSPADNSTNIGRSVDFVMTFDQNIEVGFTDRNINIIDQFTENILHSYSITSSVVTISGSTLTFSPPASALEYNQDYYINLEHAAVKNSSDQYFGGMGYSTWSLSTGPDMDPPPLITFWPDNGDTNIPEGSEGVQRSVVSMQFSEPVQTGSGNILIKRSDNDEVVISVDVTDAGKIGIFEHSSTYYPYFSYLVQVYTTTRLENLTEYYVEMPSGAIQDLLGNEFAGFSAGEWMFTIRPDITVPSVTTLAPTNNATNTNLDLSLSINFSEDVQAGSGNILVKRFSNDNTVSTINVSSTTIDGNLVTINVPATLDANTEYYVEIPSGVFTDLAGNAFGGITKPNWSFTTGDGADLIPPQLVSTEPSDGANEVFTTQLRINFDEPIQKGVGTIYVKDYSNDVVVYSVNVAEAEVTLFGSQQVRITDFALALPSNREYYVEMASGVIEDTSGNAFSGFAKGDWNYLTYDTIQPNMVSVSPADGSVGVASDATFTMELSERVFKHSSGQIRIRRTSDLFTVYSYFVQTADVAIDNNLVSFVLPGNSVLEEGVEYFVDIGCCSSSGLKDSAGNFFLGLDDHDWNFRTFSSDVSPPQITALSPMDNAVEIETNPSFQITFDENIQRASGSIYFYRASDDQIIKTVNILSSEVDITDNVLTISPYTGFVVLTEYYIQMGGVVKDQVDNIFPGITGQDWSFTTIDPGDIIAPQYLTVFPFDNSTQVPIGTDLTILFDEPIEVNELGSLSIREVATNAARVIDIASEVTVIDNSLTINPTEDLAGDVEYYVQIENVVSDLSGNYFSGFGFADYTWSFTTAPDITPPELVSTYPTFGETGIPVDADFTIEFDERIFKGTALSLWDAADDSFVELLIGSEISLSDKIATINPDSDLLPGKEYYVRVTPTAFRDVYNNYFEGLDDGEWIFTTEGDVDAEAPTVQLLFPANGSSGVSANTDLQITFNEGVTFGTGNLLIKEAVTNNVIVSENAAQVTFAGSTATIESDSPLGSNAQGYYIEVPEGFVMDLAGNPSPSITGSSTWAFTVADDQDPFVVDRYPLDEQDDVETSMLDISMNFNENIAAGTGSIFLRRSDDNTVVEEFEIGVSGNYSISNEVFLLSPSSTLDLNTHYYITICNTCIEDINGNSFDGFTDNESWDFTTQGEDIPPVIASSDPFLPADDALDVELGSNLVIRFNEDVQFSGSGFAQIKFASAGTTRETINFGGSNAVFSNNTLTLDPVLDLLPQTEFYVIISAGGVEDLAGNDFAGISDPSIWNFTTEAIPDNTAPDYFALTPYNGQTHVAIDANLSMNFTENIQKGTGNILIRQVSDDMIVQTIDVQSGIVTVTDNNLTINPADLANLTEYYVEMGPGVIEDLAGNSFSGLTAVDWAFTTIIFSDSTPPAIVNLDPVDGAMGLSDKFNMTLTFDEPIQKGFGFIQIYNDSDNLIQNINGLISTQVIFSEFSVTIDPPNNLNYDETYYLVIPNTLIKDLNNNGFQLMANEWTFSTASLDTHKPNLVGLNPEDGSEDLALNSLNLFMTFDEVVQAGTGNVYVRRNDNDEIALTKAGNQLFYVSASKLAWFNTSGLMPGTEYYVEVENNAIKDLADINFDGFGKGVWHFSTEPDVTPPSLISTSPADGDTDINVVQSLFMFFNENIQKGTGNIFLKDAATGEILDSYNVNDSEITVVTQSLSINPSQNLNYETEYEVEIPPEAFEDLSGNTFSGISDGAWTFTTFDKQSQSISFSTISDKTYGDADFNVFASATSSLAVELEIIEGPIELNGNTVSITGTGPVTIRASQPGNFQYSAAADVERSFNINKASQSISFSSIGNKTFGDPAFGLNVTVDSGVEPLLSVVDGPIFIHNDEVVIIGTGTATIAANAPGNENFDAANEVQRTFTIFSADQTISFDTPNDKSFGDLPFSLSASSSSGLDVEFSVLSGPATVSGSEVTLTGAGGVTIRASQGGDVNYNAAPFVDKSFTVNKSDQAITFNTLTDKTFGDAPFTVTANADSGLDVQFSILSGPATISGNEVSLTGAGEVTIRASQGGDVNYNAAPSVDQNFTVNKADQAITFNTLSDKTFGDAPFTVNATANSLLEVTFSILSGPATISGNEVSLTGAGEVTIRASQSGDANYNVASAVDQSFTVNKADQTITFNALLDKTFGDAPFTVNATANSGLEVEFSILSGPATISGNEVSLTGAGEVTIRAIQSGDVNYNAAPSLDQSFTVNKADQTITFNTLPDKTFGDAPFTVNATANSGLEVEFSILSGPATISGNEVSITGAGEVTIRASQVGDANYNAAPSVDQIFTVNKADQAITFTTLADKTFGDAPFTVSATADSGLEVEFSILSGPATISGNMITIAGAGEVAVQASQSGDADYNAAPSVDQSFTVDKADQIISIDNIPDQTTSSDPLTVVAMVDSGLELDYAVEGPATNSGNIITLTGDLGVVTVTVSQAGNENYKEQQATSSFEVFTTDPSDIALSNNRIDENQVSGTMVGTFSTTDLDGTDVHNYALVIGEGDDDNVSFSISGDQLLSATVFDYESRSSYSVRIRTEDGNGGSFEKMFEILVNDISEDPENNDPTDILLSGNNINENEAVGTSIGTLTASDPDSGDTHAFQLVSGEGDDDNLSFVVSGNALLSNESFDYETKTSYSIRIGTTDNDGGSFEKAFTINVNDVAEMEAQTISFEPLESKTFGDAPFELVATASSGLDVSFEVVSGPISIDGTTVNILGAGNAIIRATQDGNENFLAAESVDRMLTIEKADQTITIDPFEDKLTTDAPFMASASVGTGLPLAYSVSGPATISDQTITLDGQPGTVVLTVSQAGNENYNEATATESFDVLEFEKQDQSITFSGLVGRTYGDAPFTISATASSGLAVDFSVESGPISISGNEVTILGTGTAVIVASQSGDDSYNPATSVSQSFDIAKANQTLTFSDIADKTFGDLDFDIEISIDSELEISLTATGPIELSGKTVSILGAGTASIQASQAGNGNYNPSNTVVRTFEIAKADQLITVEEISDKRVNDDPFDVLASVDSDLDLSYSVSGPATISGITITLEGTPGTVNVEVRQAGNENYSAASEILSFEVAEVTGLDNQLSEKVKLYPNPSSGLVQFETSDQFDSIQVFDFTGVLVFEIIPTQQDQALDLSHLTKGNYILRGVNSEYTFTRRIILY